MKTTYKAAISIIAVILFACFMWWAYTIYIGQDEKSTTAAVYEDLMIEAKQMCLEKFESVQRVAHGLLDKDELSILRGEDGTLFYETENGIAPLAGSIDDETYEKIEDLMGDYVNGGTLYNIKVTPDAVLFFTEYLPSGCIGFLYEKELDNTTDYSVIEISENWNVFYTLEET